MSFPSYGNVLLDRVQLVVGLQVVRVVALDVALISHQFHWEASWEDG